MIASLRDYWGMIVTGVGAVAWLIRLEARAELNGSAIDQLKQQRHDDLIAARDARADTSQRLDDVRQDLVEIRNDIKMLLRAAK